MNNFSVGLKRIGSYIPKSLEAALNYSGKSRWVAIYRDQEIAKETGLGIFLVDGRDTYAGELQPWELFLQSDGASELKDHLEQKPDTDSWLLIDRYDRNLYVGSRTTVEGFLSQPKTQKLLLELDRDRPTRFDKYYLAGIVAGGVLITVTVLGGLGYGAYRGAEGVISYLQENPIAITFPDSQTANPEKPSTRNTPSQELPLSKMPSTKDSEAKEIFIGMVSTSARVMAIMSLFVAAFTFVRAYSCGDDLSKAAIQSALLILSAVVVVGITNRITNTLIADMTDTPQVIQESVESNR
jgi:hypothetical protein